jgi:hypothetical protein
MWRHGEDKFVGLYAIAIILHPQPLESAVHEFHVDASGSRINGIFDEFLDYARWTLHHFASSDLIDNVLG